jgi:D-glycero-D-manno-heptose 1,7-bisphosphate phosphatase
MSNRAVFLDRDGTLVRHVDYLTDPEQLELLPGTAEALQSMRTHGFLLLVVTNQSAVARGFLTEAELVRIHDRLHELLAARKVHLDGIYSCPFHPDGAVHGYRRKSNLRKPRPGMLLLAAREREIDLAASWMIGDDDRDMEAGRAAGCRTIQLQGRGSRLVLKGSVQPDFTAHDLMEAAEIIASHGKRQPYPADCRRNGSSK